jgi:hypothetical protein
MKNLLSKIFQIGKTNKEIGTAPKVELGEKLDVYIHVLETYKRDRNNINLSKDLKEGRFILLSGICGIFKIENVSELGHAAQYKLELIRENLPKDYQQPIERINNYSTFYHDDAFAIMP